MKAHQLEIGMVAHTKQGVGIVRWIDGPERAVYLADPQQDEEHFKVSFDELVEEPQLHQRSDLYY